MRTKTKTKPRKGIKRKLTFHTTETKLRAVAKVNVLIKSGMSQTQALKLVSGPLKVSEAAVQGWRVSGKFISTSSNHTPLVQPINTLGQRHLNRLTIRNIGLRTTEGKDVTLTVEEIQDIAHLAGFTS